jgi:hypothetical protein
MGDNGHIVIDRRLIAGSNGGNERIAVRDKDLLQKLLSLGDSRVRAGTRWCLVRQMVAVPGPASVRSSLIGGSVSTGSMRMRPSATRHSQQGDRVYACRTAYLTPLAIQLPHCRPGSGTDILGSVPHL